MVSWRAESLTTGTFPIEARKAKAFDRFCTGPEKPESRDGCVSRDAQLTAAKVSNPRFRGKVRKLPRYFKGDFSIRNIQVRILRGQPGFTAVYNPWLTGPEIRAFRAFNMVSRRPVSQSPA
jgi:hypothetical protein